MRVAPAEETSLVPGAVEDLASDHARLDAVWRPLGWVRDSGDDAGALRADPGDRALSTHRAEFVDEARPASRWDIGERPRSGDAEGNVGGKEVSGRAEVVDHVTPHEALRVGDCEADGCSRAIEASGVRPDARQQPLCLLGVGEVDRRAVESDPSGEDRDLRSQRRITGDGAVDDDRRIGRTRGGAGVVAEPVTVDVEVQPGAGAGVEEGKWFAEALCDEPQARCQNRRAPAFVRVRPLGRQESGDVVAMPAYEVAEQRPGRGIRSTFVHIGQRMSEALEHQEVDRRQQDIRLAAGEWRLDDEVEELIVGGDGLADLVIEG